MGHVSHSDLFTAASRSLDVALEEAAEERARKITRIVRKARISLIVGALLLVGSEVINLVVFFHPDTFNVMTLVCFLVAVLEVPAVVTSFVALLVVLGTNVKSENGAIVLLVIGGVSCAVAVLALLPFLLAVFSMGVS
jgi:hypothetical protein